MHRPDVLPQPYDGSAPPSCLGRRVVKRDDERRASQHRAHNLPLHADAAAVNDAQGFQPQTVCFFKIGFDSDGDLLRLEGVQVKDVGNGNAKGSGRSPRVVRFESSKAAPGAHPIDPPTAAGHARPEKPLGRRPARVVVKHCGAFIEAASMPRVFELEPLIIQVMAKLMAERAQESSKEVTCLRTAVRIQTRICKVSGE